MTTVDALIGPTEPLEPARPDLDLDLMVAEATTAVRARARISAVGLVRWGEVVVAMLVGGLVGALLGADPTLVIVVLVLWSSGVCGALRTMSRPGSPDVRAGFRTAVTVLAGVGLTGALLGLPSLVRPAGLVLGAALAAQLLVVGFALAALAPMRVLLVGGPDGVGDALTAYEAARDMVPVGLVVVGADVSDEQLDTPAPAELTVPLAFGVGTVRPMLSSVRADLVLVLPSAALDPSLVRRLAWDLEGSGAGLALASPLVGVASRRVAVGSLGGVLVTRVGSSRAAWTTRCAKSAFDRLGAALLLALLTPVLLMLVVAVRRDSAGPAIFRQVRTGKDGRPFTMYKFRTMTTDAETLKAQLGAADEGNGVLFKIRADPRITRVGSLLRMSSLDELPQLLNVLQGQMSLVGPRPALPEEVARYDEQARRRLAVRPGMTGLWQVSGRSDLDWQTSVALDLHYTDNITLTRDLTICLRTVSAVTGRKGAY